MNSILFAIEVDDYHEIESLPRSIKGIKTESYEVGYATDGMYWGVVFTKDNKKTNEEFMILCTENGFYMSANDENWDDWVKLCHKHNINVKFSQEDLDDWTIDKTGELIEAAA